MGGSGTTPQWNSAQQSEHPDASQPSTDPRKFRSPFRDKKLGPSVQSFRFREAWFGVQKPGRRAARSSGSGSRPATSSPASTPGGRTAGRGIAGPSSPTSRSTSPRCPVACRWRSMTEGTPEKVRTCKRSELMVLFSHQNNFGGTVIPCYGTVTMTRIMMVIAFFSRSRRITASDTIPARCTEQWRL